jgi:hypothetical protein
MPFKAELTYLQNNDPEKEFQLSYKTPKWNRYNVFDLIFIWKFNKCDALRENLIWGEVAKAPLCRTGFRKRLILHKVSEFELRKSARGRHDRFFLRLKFARYLCHKSLSFAVVELVLQIFSFLLIRPKNWRKLSPFFQLRGVISTTRTYSYEFVVHNEDDVLPRFQPPL